MQKIENDAKVYFARKGYYNGREVTVTHRDGAMVWLEDYPVGKDPVEYGAWVLNDSVSYKNGAEAANVAEVPPQKKVPKKREAKHKKKADSNDK